MCLESHRRSPQAIRPSTIYVLCEQNRLKDTRILQTQNREDPANYEQIFVGSFGEINFLCYYTYGSKLLFVNLSMIYFLLRYCFSRDVNIEPILTKLVTKLTDHFINTKYTRWVSVLLDTKHDTMANICPRVTTIRYTVWGRLNPLCVWYLTSRLPLANLAETVLQLEFKWQISIIGEQTRSKVARAYHFLILCLCIYFIVLQRFPIGAIRASNAWEF